MQQTSSNVVQEKKQDRILINQNKALEPSLKFSNKLQPVLDLSTIKQITLSLFGTFLSIIILVVSIDENDKKEVTQVKMTPRK